MERVGGEIREREREWRKKERGEGRKEQQGRKGLYNHAVLYEKNKTGRAGGFVLFLLLRNP